MALLVCLRKLGLEHGFSVTALHFEHGIRGEESRSDCNFVRSWCAENGIDCIVGHGEVPQLAARERIGIEAAARQARYAFLDDVVARGQVDLVATAHHQDDNAETVLLHAFRGCGLAGLRGIPPKRGHVVRPLLCVRRNEVLQYLRELDVSWVEDSTNLDDAYARNYMRHVVLPGVGQHISGNATQALCRLARAATVDADCLDGMAADAFSKCVLGTAADSVRLDAEAICSLHPAISARVLIRALGVLERHTDVEAIHIADVLDGMRRKKTGKVSHMGAGISARMEYGQLVLEKAAGGEWGEDFEAPFALPARIPLPHGVLVTAFASGRGTDTMGGFREYADADKMPERAVMRTRRPGDRFWPLGAPGSRKLKEYLIDKKVPRDERGGLPLLAAEGRVLWVVGHALSEDLRVDDSTTRICQMTYDPERQAQGGMELPERSRT